jgi:hypothetical protein
MTAEFDQTKFDASLNKFYEKLKSLSDSLGRGGSQGTSKGSNVPGAKASTPEQKAQKEHRLETEKATQSIKAQRMQTDAEIKASKKAVDAQEELTDAQKDAIEAQKDTIDAFKGFGKSLTGENANLSSAFNGLSSELERTGTVFGRVVGGVAFGVGYMLGNLQEFAKNAADMGAFADLSKFSVGSVTQMKLLSGLGGAFMKVIEESKGTFRAFGSNSQEAAENLSNLSRGLKYGSGYLNKTLRESLGKDLVKSVDRASDAARAMGMTDEERAKLQGQIAITAAMGAKDEKDAQQRYVKQMEYATVGTLKLSSAFGLSTKEILASMERFRQTTAGKFANARGNTGAATIAVAAEELGIAGDANIAARLAKALSEGDQGAAAGALNQAGGNAFQQRALDLLYEAQKGTDGGKNVEAFNANMKRMLPQFEALAMEGEALAVNRPELAEPMGKLLDFVTKAKTGDKDEGKKAPRNAETDNIKAMNSLTAALESLRSVILGVSIGIATLATSLGALVVAGGIGGLMSGGAGGLMSKVGDMLGGMFGKKSVGPAAGSMTGWQSGPTASAGRLVTDKMGGGFGSAAGGVMDKLSGAASKGMEGFGEMLGKLGENNTVKGAGTLALLGSALALTAVGLKTFNEVEWTSLVKGTIALGGLIGMARLVGEATTGILKGAAAIAILGAAVAISAVGFKTFNDVNWDSLIKGAAAIGILGVAAQLLGKMTSSILMGAAAIAALGATMWVAGKGFASFNEVDWGSVVKGTIALGALGVAATLLGGMSASILIGALAITALGAAMWVAGKGFQTFNELDWESMAKGVVALGAFGLAAAVMGAFLPVIIAGSVAIAALGVALGVFGAGAWVAAQAADVFAGALKTIGEVNGANLIAIGAGLAAIGAGSVIFAAGMIAATAGSILTGIMSLFGAKSPLERVMEFVPYAESISALGQGMLNFGTGIGLINDNLKALDLDALEKFKNVLVEMSNIDLPSLDGLSIPQMSTDSMANPQQQPGNGLANVLNGNTAVTPEVIAQVMSYLSSIENDIAAIRGNTKSAGYESPVRLS